MSQSNYLLILVRRVIPVFQSSLQLAFFLILQSLLISQFAFAQAPKIVSVIGGEWHSAAISDKGKVWSWGSNKDVGQLGNGSPDNSNIPVQVVDTNTPGGQLTDVKQMDASRAAGIIQGGHVIAVKNDGTVWTWGDNAWGELGDNTVIHRSTPIQVVDPGGPGGFLQNVIAVAAADDLRLFLS